jgi:DNA ligase 1
MIIYKKDTKGKIRSLEIFSSGVDLIQISGLIDGKKVEHSKARKGKNIGKSNETTPEQQAAKEAIAKIDIKLSEGYFKTIEEAEAGKIELPMLAKEYNERKHKIDWSKPVYVQPKLDGIRCKAQTNTMMSRKNKPITSLPHIIKDINDSCIYDAFDGELYAHGLNFQENTRLIKKNRPESINVKYYVYDIMLSELPFKERYAILKSTIDGGGAYNIQLVPTYRIYSEEDLNRYHKQFLSEGYEGTMVRHGEYGYGFNKRSDSLLKYKDFKDIAVKVIDIIPEDARPTHGKVVCEGDIIASLKGSHKEREELLTNKESYIGETAEIRFFEYLESGLPRFPVCYGFRLDR